jgi:hypothetical protein
MGSVGPLGVSTPSGLVLGRRGRTHCCADNALRAPSASLQRPIAAPPHRPEIPKELWSDDASFPGLSCPTTHAGTADPLPAGRPAPQRATSEVWLPPSRRPPPFLREPCGPRASTGFSLRGVLLVSVGLPLGSPCPPAVTRVDSPRPLRSVRTRPASGPRSRHELVRSVEPLRARRVDASVRFFPSERSPPPSLRALHGFAPAPPPRVGRDDVPTRLRLEVLRNRGIGWPLSGLPALLGFVTLRPSRRHEDRAEGGLMDSPLGSRRVRASNRSKPSRSRPDRGVSLGPTPPSIGERLLPHPVVRACLRALSTRERRQGPNEA